jgi:hypothetical protein
VAEHVGKGAKGQSGDTTAGIDGSEMQFARDLAQWRVRVQEADGKIFDELFDTEDAARTYIADQFGSEAMQNLVEDGPSFAFRTSLGQKGMLARPIGADADVLDLLTGQVKEILTPDGKPTGRFTAVQKFSPVARLERYSQLNRDLHTHSFLESLRNSGLVITRAQADDMGLTKTGTKEMGKWASHWRPLPNDKRRFGNMADNFVHARLFTEINNMHGTYEGLRALFDGVNDMWDQLGYSDMGNLFQGVLGKLGNFDERLGGVVKFTQIAANQAAIASNIVSNFLFSSLAIGSKLFDTNNWPEFAGAMQDVFGFGAAGLRRPKVMHVPDEIYSEAVKEGLLGTSIFTRSNNPYLRNAFLRQAKLFDAPAMEKRYQRLQSLYGAALERGDDAAKLGNIKLEIDALEQSLQHAQRGNTRKFMEWAMGTLGAMEKNTLGLPASNLNAAMREFYGKIDDFFKLATYRIARKTMPQKKAGWAVRAFMQDYANVSPVVTRLSKTPLIGGLVPSFTHEMVRITKNAMRFQPLRLMAIMGAGQAFNAVSAMQAGVSDERVRAIEDSMGIQDPLEKLIKGSTSVRFYDPRTKNLRFSVDFGDTLLPLFNFTQGYSALGRLAEGSSDPRERSHRRSTTDQRWHVHGLQPGPGDGRPHPGHGDRPAHEVGLHPWLLPRLGQDGDSAPVPRRAALQRRGLLGDGGARPSHWASLQAGQHRTEPDQGHVEHQGPGRTGLGAVQGARCGGSAGRRGRPRHHPEPHVAGHLCRGHLGRERHAHVRD